MTNAGNFRFTPELFSNLIEAMFKGVTVSQWLDIQYDLGQPVSRTALTNYINSDSANKNAYALAREACADALAEDVVRLADNGLDPQRTANKMKARQWLAAKYKPKDYGDKLDLDVKGQIDVMAAVLAGRRRIQQLDSSAIIDQPGVLALPDIDPFS